VIASARAAAGPAERFTIVGLFGLKGQPDLGGVTVAAFDLPTSERVLASPGVIDAVYVTTGPGVTPGAASSNLAAALGPSFEVVSAAKLAEERADPVRQGVGNLRIALVGFAAVGLVVGSFIIFNTFAILIAQRTRELGLLRALAASRSQVLWSVVLEATIVGVVAAGLGLAAGVGLARLAARSGSPGSAWRPRRTPWCCPGRSSRRCSSASSSPSARRSFRPFAPREPPRSRRSTSCRPGGSPHYGAVPRSDC
jgi:hypothetical protein